jgi:hypothetical protein
MDYDNEVSGTVDGTLKQQARAIVCAYTDCGMNIAENKIKMIKTLRSLNVNYGLMDSKNAIESATGLTDVKKWIDSIYYLVKLQIDSDNVYLDHVFIGRVADGVDNLKTVLREALKL